MILILAPAASMVTRAQNVDSLKKALFTAKDTNEIDCLNALSNAYILLENKDSAKYYAVRAGDQAKALNYMYGLAVSRCRLSQIAKHFDDDFINSERWGKESLYWYEKTAKKEGISTVYYYLVYSIFAQSRFDEAIYYAEKRYALVKAENSSLGKIEALTWLSAIYRQTGNYEKSFLMARESYDFASAAKNKHWISTTLYHIAQLYAHIEDYPNALIYFRRVLQMDDDHIRNERIRGDIDIWLKMEFAEVFSHLKQFDSAWYYYRLFKPTKDKSAYLRVYWISTGECYLLQKDYHNALKNFELGLAGHIKLNDRNEIMRALLDIGKTYLALENNEAALEYGRKGLAIALETRAKQFIRDGFLILSTAFDRMQQADSSNFYYRNYIYWKESIANDQLKAKFTAYRYEEQIKLLDKENQLQQQLLKQSSEHKKMLTIVIGLLLLFGIIFIRFIMLKRKILQNELQIQKLENDRKQAAFQQQATELEMQALRAQMNPHFIFNCLSSINSFILKNESEAASDYLTKFARLIRMVMHNSKEAVITLEDELEMLQLYLDMERLRFKKAFDYTITFKNEVDASFIYIPPLLLQPFAENAIWHGLLHKEGKKHLSIAFSEENNLLHCSIVDNGIGREAATTVEGKSPEKQKSMGLKITRQRLALFNGVKDLQNVLAIEDLFDQDGRATGTRVQLTIRIKRNTEPV
ncbi:tetratricopeptide repeat-containing sensor histidine kinase [Longitalea arenae]|uniref:tetratricopeptide repeat-containing sensor histidine kinase n=1 Tax=Longitalea arenae TaxID=2812558 RepID=UPI0019672086|nr:histidine kinase [Longitalea arenae]